MRQTVLMAGLALAGASLPFKAWKNYEPQVVRRTLESPYWQGKGRLRIGQIADFHGGDGIWSGRALAKVLRREQVDLICITGDFFEPSRALDEPLAFLEGVCDWRPIYFVSGNHDEGMADFAALKDEVAHRYGVHILDNRNCRVRVRDSWVDVFGVRDHSAAATETQWLADLQAQLRPATADDAFHLLLCHRPEMTALFDQLQVHLVLCGHAHGGQWRLGARQGVLAPGQGIFPRLTRGIYQRGKKHPYHMVVSAGFAVDPMVPRLNNRPELVITDIVAAGV